MNYAIAAGAVILGIFVLWRSLRCVHAWEFVDKTEFDSRLGELRKQGYTLNTVWDRSLLLLMSYRKVIIVIRCQKCGNCKVIKETSA